MPKQVEGQTAPKPVLVQRCREKGHSLAAVHYEQGKPYVYLRTTAITGTLEYDVTLHGVPMRVDLNEAVAEKELVTVNCKCGSRILSYVTLLDLLEAGTTGTVLTDAPIST